jgi:hypothetical protein
MWDAGRNGALSRGITAPRTHFDSIRSVFVIAPIQKRYGLGNAPYNRIGWIARRPLRGVKCIRPFKTKLSANPQLKPICGLPSSPTPFRNGCTVRSECAAKPKHSSSTITAIFRNCASAPDSIRRCCDRSYCARATAPRSSSSSRIRVQVSHRVSEVCRRAAGPQLPMRRCENELNSPNTFRSHSTTTITTTPFKIDLIVPCIGMNRLISHRITPTTIKTPTTCISGMSLQPPCANNRGARIGHSFRLPAGFRHTAKDLILVEPYVIPARHSFGGGTHLATPLLAVDSVVSISPFAPVGSGVCASNQRSKFLLRPNHRQATSALY